MTSKSQLDREAPRIFRVDKEHGGELVEEVETPEPMNNPDCEHQWEIDESETDFLAYMCIKEDCGMISLYDK